MFTIFHGFHLVEEYHQWKKEHRSNRNPVGVKAIKLFFAIAIPLFFWIAPSSLYGLSGLTPVEHRVLAIFVFAALMWLFDAVPAWTTSLVVVVLLLFCASNSALWFFQTDANGEKMTNLVNNTAILHCFADPTIMLFIGGFIIAIAATKSGLDIKLAKVMLLPFGTKSENVLLGFILVTAIFSMFISNTATAAMMLTFLAPVLSALPADGKGKIGLALAIPVGANIGGMGTPIGTPPNAIALKFLNDPEGMNMGIGFGITKRDLEQLSWSILWMIAGAFALGVAMQQSGLAAHLIESVPFDTWSPLVVIIGSGLLCYLMANFISHTATAALFIPILAIAGSSMTEQLAPFGGVSTLLIGVAICSSVAMVLPISTPPNALADATGFIQQKYMVKTGLIMGCVGLLLGYIVLIFCGSHGIF